MASSATTLQERGYEYVALKDFPTMRGFSEKALDPLNKALNEMRGFQAGEGVRVRQPGHIKAPYFQKLIHLYAERRGFAVRVKKVGDWTYIQKRGDETRLRPKKRSVSKSTERNVL